MDIAYPLEQLVRQTLMFGIVPFWLLMGAIDAWFHRRDHIENSAGLHESLLHLAMVAEIGVGVLLAVFFEINALVLGLLASLCVAHEFTSLADQSYSSSRRRISVGELHVHSFKDSLPLFSLLLLALLHADQWLMLFKPNGTAADFALRFKREPLPWSYSGSVLAAAVLLVVIPFLFEQRRCRLAQQSSQVPPLVPRRDH
ncbi:MAG: diguanylate cyclase [Rhizobacter sp.]|nr:diguanylate cyclase [Rhizobacter sp.]